MAPDDPPLLDNIFWRCLDGPHRPLAEARGQARRDRTGYSPIAAFADPSAPDLDGLAAMSAPGESFYVSGWNGACASPDWQIDVDASMVCMAWDGGPVPDPVALECRLLSPEDLPAVMTLVELTRPGPFGPHTLSMGEFLGHFDAEGRLVAMAGERTRAHAWHEVSGICTHPDHQGRGLGRALTLEVGRRQLLRCEVPFLHAMAGNETALAMYRRLGFSERLVTPIRVLRRIAPGRPLGS